MSTWPLDPRCPERGVAPRLTIDRIVNAINVGSPLRVRITVPAWAGMPGRVVEGHLTRILNSAWPGQEAILQAELVVGDRLTQPLFVSAPLRAFTVIGE